MKPGPALGLDGRWEYTPPMNYGGWTRRWVQYGDWEPCEDPRCTSAFVDMGGATCRCALHGTHAGHSHRNLGGTAHWTDAEAAQYPAPIPGSSPVAAGLEGSPT